MGIQGPVSFNDDPRTPLLENTPLKELKSIENEFKRPTNVAPKSIDLLLLSPKPSEESYSCPQAPKPIIALVKDNNVAPEFFGLEKNHTPFTRREPMFLRRVAALKNRKINAVGFKVDTNYPLLPVM